MEKPSVPKEGKLARMNPIRWVVLATVGLLTVAVAGGQMIDNTQALNPINAGINKSLPEEVGCGRGNINTPCGSLYIIKRDPFRSVRRGRQLFQRKFTRTQGQGPGVQDGVGNIASNIAIGGGVVDSCAGCHARPRGSAGFGGDVVTRPDSRNTPHLFGLGLKEMLADEMTSDLRAIRSPGCYFRKTKRQPGHSAARDQGRFLWIDYGQSRWIRKYVPCPGG
jgi:hypothetical protein